MTVSRYFRTLRPEAAHELDVVMATARRTVDPLLLDLISLSIAQLIGHAPAAVPGTYPSSDQLTELERDCIAFTEQFVIDVSGISDAQREAIRGYFPGDRARLFASALYVTEFTQRLELMAPRLLPSPAAELLDAGGMVDVVEVSTETDELTVVDALRGYQDAVMRGGDLDPVVTELVRLRCARTHDCRICKTLRLDSARAAGVDDDMTAKVDFYEETDLAEPLKLALRITDAFITRPDTMSEQTALAARVHYTPEQLEEMCLDITKWSTQKIHVSLGTDGADRLPVGADGVSYFDFGDDGAVAGYSPTPSTIST